MRDFIAEYEQLNMDINEEIVNIYDELKTLGAEQPLAFCGEVKNDFYEIKINLEIRIDGWFTKVSSICRNRSKFFAKGFQVGRGRYRMKPIVDLPINQKQKILEHLIAIS